MNILIINHYYEQDIDALLSANRGHTFQIVSYLHFYKEAQRYFPASVFIGLEEYHRPVHAEARQRYAARARQMVHELYYLFPFDVVIAPSDTFFYIRPVVTAVQEMGVPFIVVQKETTISPHTMIAHAQAIGRYYPFIGDHMLVCSHRHKQFWLNAGADPDKITVTGQPRFDLYCQPHRWHSWSELGLQVDSTRRTILFFSYDLGAYSPEGEMAAQSWAQLRTETEEALIALVHRGGYNLLIKPHPQQDVIGERARLRAMAGVTWGKAVQLLPAELDARQLIINADIVVGFQTTALFEAMIAGKEVIYTYWTEPAERFAADLIPFHKRADLLRCVRSPQELTNAVLDYQGDVTDKGVMKQRLAFFKEYLGPLDGHASERALRIIEECTAQCNERISEEARALRRRLDAYAPAYCRRALPWARAASWAWTIAGWLWPLEYPLWKVIRSLRHRGQRVEYPSYGSYRAILAARRKKAYQRVTACQVILKRSACSTAQEAVPKGRL